MNLLYKTLDHVCVLGVQVERLRKMFESFINSALLFIDFANDYVNRSFLRHLLKEEIEHLQGLIELVKRHQDCCLLVKI